MEKLNNIDEYLLINNKILNFEEDINGNYKTHLNIKNKLKDKQIKFSIKTNRSKMFAIKPDVNLLNSNEDVNLTITYRSNNKYEINDCCFQILAKIENNENIDNTENNKILETRLPCKLRNQYEDNKNLSKYYDPFKMYVNIFYIIHKK